MSTHGRSGTSSQIQLSSLPLTAAETGGFLAIRLPDQNRGFSRSKCLKLNLMNYTDVSEKAGGYKSCFTTPEDLFNTKPRKLY